MENSPIKIFPFKYVPVANITDLTDIVRWGSYPAFAIGWQWFERVLNMDEHLKDTDALMYRNKKAYYEDNFCKRTDMLD